MTHPSQLTIFHPIRKMEVVELKPTITDLKDWRKSDLLDLLELVCTLVQSDEWKADAQSLHHLANELRLPASLITLVLNSIGRLEELLGIDRSTQELKVDGKHFPNVTALATHCGLGGVFTKDVEAIWKPVEEVKPLPDPLEPEPGEEQPRPMPMQPTDYLPSECKITTNPMESGRQWKIAGQLISEVEHIAGLGHVGRLYSGSHVTPLKPYHDYEPAATQCRAHAEGVLKFLKTIPR
jgi:hypothetical protein